ncbi:MAG: hypothetical protein HY481_00175 [Candidatus Vogelbacteria bacterium]|nr:hypothetical protein [Candidatus Vogelbacteria bacterium]
MPNPTLQEISKRLETIPPALKNLYLSAELGQKYHQLENKYALEFEQAGRLSNEIDFTLLKLAPVSDLAERIQRQVGMPEDRARSITLDIDREILSPVRQLLNAQTGAEPKQEEHGFGRLPAVIQKALEAIDLHGIMRKIGTEQKLHIDQMGILDNEVGSVLVGETRPEEFLPRLKSKLQIDQVAAEAIAKEVNEQIFLPIRESLQKLHEAGEAIEAKEAIEGGVETIPAVPSTPLGASELPDKDKLLDEIENPSKTPEDTVFEKKLGQLFRIPREEVDLDPYLEKPE